MQAFLTGDMNAHSMRLLLGNIREDVVLSVCRPTPYLQEDRGLAECDLPHMYVAIGQQGVEAATCQAAGHRQGEYTEVHHGWKGATAHWASRYAHVYSCAGEEQWVMHSRPEASCTGCIHAFCCGH
jgi:hypothetical protein